MSSGNERLVGSDRASLHSNICTSQLLMWVFLSSHRFPECLSTSEAQRARWGISERSEWGVNFKKQQRGERVARGKQNNHLLAPASSGWSLAAVPPSLKSCRWVPPILRIRAWKLFLLALFCIFVPSSICSTACGLTVLSCCVLSHYCSEPRGLCRSSSQITSVDDWMEVLLKARYCNRHAENFMFNPRGGKLS